MSKKKTHSIPGILLKGYGVASGQGNTPYSEGSIGLQAPFFKELGLDIGGFFFGTLNIDIHPLTFEVTKPDFHFPQVKWTERHPPEDFSFVRGHISFQGIQHPALLYYPSPKTKNAHHHTASTMEILAPFIDEISTNSTVELTFPKKCIMLEDANRPHEYQKH